MFILLHMNLEYLLNIDDVDDVIEQIDDESTINNYLTFARPRLKQKQHEREMLYKYGDLDSEDIQNE